MRLLAFVVMSALTLLGHTGCAKGPSDDKAESDGLGGSATGPDGAGGQDTRSEFSCDDCDSGYQSCNAVEERCELLEGKCEDHADCVEGEALRCAEDHSCGVADQVGTGCDCGAEFDYCLGTSIQVEIARDYDNAYSYEFHGNDGEPVACGRFADGDYWLAPAPGQTSVEITLIDVEGGTGGADLDPTVESQGFLDSPYGNYDASRNLMSQLPFSVSDAKSLVVGTQKDEGANGACETKAIVGSCIDTYNVLSILARPLVDSEEFLRPAIYDVDKALTSLDDLALDTLPSSELFEGTDADGLQRIRESWTHHLESFSLGSKTGQTYSEGGRAFRADLVTEEYAANMAQSFHHDLLTLFSNQHALEEKTPALAAMVTFGQDLFHALYECDGGCDLVRQCKSGAGQWLGKLPALALFAGLHDDPRYSEALSKMSVEQQGGNACQEIEQVNSGVDGRGIWGDGPDDVSTDLQGSLYRYWSAIVAGHCFSGAEGFECDPNQGKKTARDYYGYIDGPAVQPGSSYLSVTSGPIRALAVEMMLFPRMREAVNYDVIIEYAARLQSDSEGVGILINPDECAPPDPRDFCDIADIDDPSKTGCYGLSASELNEDCGIWSQREQCGHFGNGPLTEPHMTEVTWGTEPNLDELDDVTGKCVKKGVTWTRDGDTWTSAPAQPGDPNYGRPGRFTSEVLPEFEVGNRVGLAETAFDAALAQYRN